MDNLEGKRREQDGNHREEVAITLCITSGYICTYLKKLASTGDPDQDAPESESRSGSDDSDCDASLEARSLSIMSLTLITSR